MANNKYTVMSEEAIRYMCGLIRNLANVSEGIDDLNLRSDGVMSSVKVDKLIKQCLQDANDYSDQVVSALTHLVAEKIDFEPTLDNTADKLNTLLLYSKNSDNNYTQYLRLTNELLNLGDTSLSLNEYLKISDADKFVLKTSYDDLVTKVNEIDNTIGTETLNTTSQTLTGAVNNLVTSVEKKIDKDKIVTVLDDTVTDEQILNALALKELLDEKNVENLFPIQYYNNTSDTRAGITATINNDRSVTFKGTATEQYFFVLWHKDNNGLGKAVALRGKTITITGGLASPVLSLAFYDEEGNNITPPDNAMKYDFGDGLTIKVPDNAYSVYSYYYCSANAVLDCTVYPMLEIGNVAHDYCPPNGTALTKGDIGDSINSDSTADEIVSAKLAFTNLIRGNSAIQSYLDEIGTNDVLQFPEGKHIISEKVTYTNLPEGVQGGYLEIWNMNGRSYETPFNSAWRYRVVKLQDFNTKKSYYRVLRAGETAVFLDTGWQRVCVTKVADVPFTELTVNNWAKGNIIYTVKDGICYLWVSGLESSTMDKHSQTLVSNIPKPKRGGLWYNIVSADCTKGGLLLSVTPDGTLENYSGINNVTYFGTFSYPVKE